MDEVFAGVFIAAFSVIGCGLFGYIIHECRSKPLMKKSRSLEDLQSQSVEDPDVVV